MQRVNAIVLAVGLVGVAYSATAFFQELFTSSATLCPVLGETEGVLGYPMCVYGFFTYLVVTIVAALCLARGWL